MFSEVTKDEMVGPCHRTEGGRVPKEILEVGIIGQSKRRWLQDVEKDMRLMRTTN